MAAKYKIVSREMVRELAEEARQNRDAEMLGIAQRALDGSAEDYAECAQVILDVHSREPGRYGDSEQAVRQLCREVAQLAGDDGTDGIRVCVEHALAEDPCATAQQIAAVVREAIEDATIEREQEG